MMKYILTLIFLISSISCTFSQQMQIFGNITDLQGIPLAGATINYKVNQGTIADKNGNFYFETEAETSLKLTIRFIGYETLDTLLNIENDKQLFLNFKLKQQLTELPNIEITAAYQNIFEDYKHHIVDFTILNDIIYLIIQKESNTYLSRANLKGVIIEENKLDGGYKSFHNSCLGGIILVGNNYCAELHVLNGKILITNEFSIEYFDKYITPCKLQKNETLIFKGISRHNKKIDYFRFFEDQNPHIIYTIHDKDGEKVSQSYFRDLLAIYYSHAETVNINDIDYGFERDNIIADGSWSGDIQDLIITNLTHEYALQYQALGMTEVKSDLFVVDNEIFILDELNESIVRVNEDLKTASKVDDFVQNRNINIISDYENETYFQIDNTLYAINIDKNGFNIIPFKKLEHSYFTQRNLLYKGILYRLGRKAMNNIKKTIFRDVLH